MVEENKTKKIAFIGTHATGKTTLVHTLVSALKKKSCNVDVVLEVSRDCPLPVNENTTRDAQRWILATQYIREIERSGKCDYLVCDRSLLDNYAYYVNKFGRSKALEPFILEHMETYDYLFKVPINKKYLFDDRFRSLDRKFQEDIDNRVNSLLRGFNIEYREYHSMKDTLKEVFEKK